MQRARVTAPWFMKSGLLRTYLLLAILGVFALRGRGQVAILLSGLERGFFEYSGYESWLKYVHKPLRDQGLSLTLIVCVEVGAYSETKNSAGNAANLTTPLLLEKLDIESIKYYDANRYQRVEKCSQELYAHKKFDTFEYIVYTRPDIIWTDNINLTDVDPETYSIQIRARALLACPSMHINDDWLGWRGCSASKGHNKTELVEEDCTKRGLAQQGIRACVLPDDQIAVVPKALARYFVLAMSNFHSQGVVPPMASMGQRGFGEKIVPPMASMGQRGFGEKMKADFEHEKLRIRQNDTYLMALKSTYGVDRKYVASCARAGLNMDGFKRCPEAHYLRNLDSLGIPFQVHPFPFRPSDHFGSYRWKPEWSPANWIC